MKPNLRLLPTEVWVDILCYRQPWLTRSKLGELVDQIGNRKFAEFLQFYLHDWGKQTIGYLIFKEEGLFVNGENSVAIAETPMPENIKFFKEILIKHFDAQTLAFLRLIQPLLNNVNLVTYFKPGNQADLRTILAHLSPLLNGGVHSIWCHENYIPWANQLFTGNLNLDQLKVLSFNNFDFIGWFLPLTEQAAALDATINFFMNWLKGERDCAEPKLYRTYIHPKFFPQVSAAIQKDFLAAKSTCTFALKLERDDQYLRGYDGWREIPEFHLENNIGEHLDCKFKLGHKQQSCFQISRHQANANAGTRLQEWVEENEKKRGMARIQLCDTTIGQIDATGGGEVDSGGEAKTADQPSTSKQA